MTAVPNSTSVPTDDAKVAFRDCHVAFSSCSPRGRMERKDAAPNAQIFSHKQSLNEVATGTCAFSSSATCEYQRLIAKANAKTDPGIHGMTRLDQTVRCLSWQRRRLTSRHPPHEIWEIIRRLNTHISHPRDGTANRSSTEMVERLHSGRSSVAPHQGAGAPPRPLRRNRPVHTWCTAPCGDWASMECLDAVWNQGSSSPIRPSRTANTNRSGLSVDEFTVKEWMRRMPSCARSRGLKTCSGEFSEGGASAFMQMRRIPRRL